MLLPRVIDYETKGPMPGKTRVVGQCCPRAPKTLWALLLPLTAYQRLKSPHCWTPWTSGIGPGDSRDTPYLKASFMLPEDSVEDSKGRFQATKGPT